MKERRRKKRRTDIKRTKGRKYTKWIIDDANPPTH